MGIERMPRARLDVGGEVAVSGGELPYVIANEGDVPLLFGAGYGFEEAPAEGGSRCTSDRRLRHGARRSRRGSAVASCLHEYRGISARVAIG
jgi:hypothetical protein